LYSISNDIELNLAYEKFNGELNLRINARKIEEQDFLEQIDMMRQSLADVSLIKNASNASSDISNLEEVVEVLKTPIENVSKIKVENIPEEIKIPKKI